MGDLERFVAVIGQLYGPLAADSPLMPVYAGHLVRTGAWTLEEAARRAGKPERSVKGWVSALESGGLWGYLGSKRELDLKPARVAIAQLLLGQVAERAFEQVFRERLGAAAARYVLKDQRESRTDTDFLLLNGSDRPLCRLNIKFHGTLFRMSQDLVGLEPEDCFALATYKIHQGLLKQEQQHVPFVFLVISAPDFSAASIQDTVPEDFAWFCAVAKSSARSLRVRQIEERVVDKMIEEDPLGTVAPLTRALSQKEWRFLSAGRANKLLLEHLFQRVYALRVRAFAQNYRAEVDMHLSMSREMVGLEEFLSILEEHGPQGLAVRLDRGTI